MLRPRGYQVFAVSPNAKQVEGDPSYPNVKSVPGGIDAVVIGTRPALAGDTIRECAERASSRCGCIAAREWEASPRLLPSTGAHTGSPSSTAAAYACSIPPQISGTRRCVFTLTGKVPRQV